MEVPGAEDEGGDEEEAHAGVEGETDGSPHQRLAEGAAESQGIADEVELGDLVGVRQQSSDVAHDGVEANIQPAADGKVGRVLPRLKTVAMA